MGGLKLKDPILLLIYQSNFILYEFEWYKFLADWLIRTLTYTFSAYSGPIICQTFLLIWSTIAYIIFACIRWSSAIFIRIAFYCNQIKLDMRMYLQFNTFGNFYIIPFHCKYLHEYSKPTWNSAFSISLTK